MDKRIIKTALVFFIAAVWGLIIPIFGQWYQQKTGLDPIALWLVGSIGGIVITIMSVLKIWGEIK